MKIFITLSILFTCFTLYGQEYFLVNAKNNLNVRAQPNLSSQTILKIPYGTIVEKVGVASKELTVTVNGKQVKGHWLKIRYNNYTYLLSEETEQNKREGYVFDAYLINLNNKHIINTTKITRLQFEDLLTVAIKSSYKSKKVTDLDSIKTILKGRVNWVTEANEFGEKRDDKIKSILTNSGRKLTINQENNEYVFSKDWSGYYPEYDILVMEGGHTSDKCFSIKTGESEQSVGNPDYMIPSPKKTYRLNGYFGGQECFSYFFQVKEKGQYHYLTQLNPVYDVCHFEKFYWLNELQFIYKKKYFRTDSIHESDIYFRGEIKKTP